MTYNHNVNTALHLIKGNYMYKLVIYLVSVQVLSIVDLLVILMML